jgi:hypothetical protein
VLDLYSDARQYLSLNFGGADMSDVSDEAVVNAVEHTFAGGWNAYRAAFARSQRAEATSSHLSPIGKWSKLRRIVGGTAQTFHLRPYDEVESVWIDEEECKAVIKTGRARYHHRRDVVTHTGYRLMVWKLEEYGHPSILNGLPFTKRWMLSIIEVETADHQEFAKFGKIWDQARAEDDAWQAAECYRPGTKSTPMDGPIRALELSHKDVFGVVKAPPAHTTETKSKS